MRVAGRNRKGIVTATVSRQITGLIGWLAVSFIAALIGGAAFQAARTALSLFLAQLAPNAIWSWLFFDWHLGAWAFADIVLLWVLVVATLVAFWRVRPVAGVLLIPYLLWVSFASVLNYSVWRLNPGILG